MTLIAVAKLSRRPVIAFALLGVLWGGFAALVPEIKQRIGASDALFGSLMLLSSVGLMSATWLAPLADRVLARASLPVALLAISGAFSLVGGAEAAWVFGFGMMLAGASSGVTDVIMNARVADIEAQSKQGLMGFNHAMFSFAYAVAALTTGGLRELGWDPVQVIGLLAMIVLACGWLSASTPHKVQPSDAGTPKVPRNLIMFGGLTLLLAFMAETSMESWSALHIERSLAGRAVQGALGPFLLGMTMGIGRLLGQLFLSRMPAGRTLFWASLLTTLGALVAAVAPAPWVAYCGFATLGFGVSVIVPVALAMVGRQASAEHRTAAIARVSVIGFSGFLVAPAVMGYLSELASLRWAFATMGLLVLFIPMLCLPKLRA